MNSSKIVTLLVPVIVAITLIAVIWLGVTQKKSSLEEDVLNNSVITGSVE